MRLNFSKIMSFLNGLPDRSFIMLMFAFYAVTLSILIFPYNMNPSALIRFGNYYIEQNESLTPEGSVRFLGNEEYGGNGYDGQIFYYYSRSLFMNHTWPEGFNNAYRAPRIGYPLLSAFFSIFGSWGVVFGMIFVQIGLSLFSLQSLLKILPENKRFLSIFYIFSPFSLQSVSLLVSDSVMVSLVIIGYSFYIRIKDELSQTARNDAGAFFFFSLAVLTKESSLFFLFPLGLSALFTRNPKKIILMLSVLLPMVIWQVYLRQAHGMLPAGVLKIFLSPLDGILGMFESTGTMMADYALEPSFSRLFALIKHSIKWLLVFLIVFSFRSLFSGGRIQFGEDFALRAGILLTLLSVIMADYYYFWGIYENISRMFTILVPLMILYISRIEFKSGQWFFLVLSILSLLVFLRIVVLSPVYPHDTFRTYTGKSYQDHAPVPGKP